MPFIDQSKPVIVTGGTGFIASWIIKYLLEEGYTVKTSVRDKSKTKKTEHLYSLSEEYPGKLELFVADLLDKDVFKDPVKGAELVIHTASPFKVQNVKDPQAELIDPALKGTQHVLEAVNNSGSVKRVVLTSSVVAIYGDSIEIYDNPEKKFTEEHWNDTSNLQHQPYAYSKTLAEKKAWELNKNQDNWDLVVINPGFVMGPSLAKKSDSQSISFFNQLMSGKLKFGVPELYNGYVDVRDVARAHITAGLKQEANGRHILVNKTMGMLDMVNLVKKHIDDPSKLPKGYLPKFVLYLFGPFQGFSWKYIRRNIGIPIGFDNSYSIKDLDVQYTDPEITFKDQLEQMN